MGLQLVQTDRAVPILVPDRHRALRAEAARRIRLSGYDAWTVREFATGQPMPTEIRSLQLQIAFIAEALARLSPPPADFADDKYWPRP